MIRLHFLGSATGKATTAMAGRWGGTRQGARSVWGGGTNGPAGSADSEIEKAISQPPTRLHAATQATLLVSTGSMVGVGCVATVACSHVRSEGGTFECGLFFYANERGKDR